jgi:23S rRNA (cytosine1962-C5)-methyltransferase
MKLLKTHGWAAYELIDSGHGMRLERFGPYKIARPDPQCIWSPILPKNEWEAIDAVFVSDGKKGSWKQINQVPDKWLIPYNELKFYAKLTPFKHTGIFPEQHLQWDWMRKMLSSAKEQPNVLNLFAYTGIASIAAASEGAKVTHVDASKPSISWARENQAASGMQDKPIRWILDDALKFVAREGKRGVRYDGIVMDPPVYGHGPDGEIWDFQKSFPELLKLCTEVLTDQPLFIIVNAYAISASFIMLENVLKEHTEHLGGVIESGELALEEKNSQRLLSTGIFARWSNK